MTPEQYNETKKELEQLLGTEMYSTGGHHHGYAKPEDDADFFADPEHPGIVEKLLSLGFLPTKQVQYEDRNEWEVYRKNKVDIWLYNYPIRRVREVHYIMKQLFGPEFALYSLAERRRKYDLVFSLI